MGEIITNSPDKIIIRRANRQCVQWPTKMVGQVGQWPTILTKSGLAHHFSQQKWWASGFSADFPDSELWRDGKFRDFDGLCRLWDALSALQNSHGHFQNSQNSPCGAPRSCYNCQQVTHKLSCMYTRHPVHYKSECDTHYLNHFRAQILRDLIT